MKGAVELYPGMRVGKLTLMSKISGSKWECLCDCGKTTTVTSDHLRDGHTRSCGCLRTPDLTGRRFGMLTVIGRAPNYEKGKNKMSRWECLCDCGNTRTYLGTVLQRGDANSCGCQKARWNGEAHTTHGGSKSRLYRRWAIIKRRCADTSIEHARNYRNRGITVCEEWLGPNGYANFREWALNNGYSPELTIDRIDNEKGYSPDNCRWIPEKEQHSNVRNNVWLEYKGGMYLVSQLSAMSGIPADTLRDRVRRGWSVDKAVETPVKPRKKRGANLQ